MLCCITYALLNNEKDRGSMAALDLLLTKAKGIKQPRVSFVTVISYQRVLSAVYRFSTFLD